LEGGRGWFIVLVEAAFSIRRIGGVISLQTNSGCDKKTGGGKDAALHQGGHRWVTSLCAGMGDQTCYEIQNSGLPSAFNKVGGSSKITR